MKPKHARPAIKSDETPEFVEFWNVWQPVKSEYDGRAMARDRFFFHVWWRDADPADLVDGARFYVHNFKTGQLRLLSAEWMNRGMYEDDAEKWRTRIAAQQDGPQKSSVVQIFPKPGQTKSLREFERRKAAGE